VTIERTPANVERARRQIEEAEATAAEEASYADMLRSHADEHERWARGLRAFVAPLRAWWLEAGDEAATDTDDKEDA
jgi:hypothetical protein